MTTEPASTAPPVTESTASGRMESGRNLTDTQRNGSIAGIAILLGFSLNFTAGWSYGDDPWDYFGVAVFAIAAAGIALQVRALFRIMPLPMVSLREHAEIIRLFSRGVLAVLLAYVLHSLFNVVIDLTKS